jgi:adenine-specific DNA-methyltransferase
MRRAGAKILAEWQEKQSQIGLGEDGEQTAQTPPDIGFRVFKLAKSNFKIWDDTPIDGTNADIERFHEQLEIFADNPFIEGRTHEDIIYEIMRMNNYPLTTPIIPIPLEEIAGQARNDGDRVVYGIGEDCDFIICLDVLIDDAAAEELCEYRPGRI